MNHIAPLFPIIFPCALRASQTSPYTGEERQPINALSQADIRLLTNGAGMGLAKVAELNHFPGPRHVPALSEERGLTAAQHAATETLFEEMQQDAITFNKAGFEY